MMNKLRAFEKKGNDGKWKHRRVNGTKTYEKSDAGKNEMFCQLGVEYIMA